MIRILTFVFIGLSAYTCLAQEMPADTLKPATTDTRSELVVDRSQDTVLIKSYAQRYDPRKALLYAAVLPGSGQIYTKKYWKIPLVWGGMAATGYSINYYQRLYTDYKSYLFTLLTHGKVTVPNGRVFTSSEDNVLRTAIDKARRQRDFMIIIMGLVYVLQIVDAHVDAHLKEFDLNPNLHVRLQPTMESDQLLGRQTGFTMTVRF